MDEINLNQIIIDHPDCLKNGSKLRAVLLDLYPSASKAIVNTLATMVGAGIADEIVRADKITDFDKNRWHKKLEDDYGLSEKIICSCLDLLFGSLNSIRLCIKENEKPVNNPSPSEQSQKPSHSCSDDFEIINGVLKKYRGKDSIVVIPNNVTSIGNSAFSDCRSLLSVTIPNSVTTIGSNAFENCVSLTSVTIPNSVTSIGSGAFYDCSSLKSVTIADSVTSIGNRVFGNCRELTQIDFGGSEDQWKSIKKAIKWNQGIPINCKTYFSSSVKYVYHKQMGYGKVESSDRFISVRFDNFPYKSYIYRTSDLGTVLRKVSDNEYFSARKPAEQTPEQPTVYISYSDNDKRSEKEFDYWNRLCSSGTYENPYGEYENPDDEYNYTDDDNTDDEYDYSDDYDFSDSDYDDSY